MSEIALPALRGDDPLGFLAALGIIEVLRSEAGVSEEELALGWEGVGGPAALRAPFGDVGELARALWSAARTMQEEGRVLAGAPPDLPPARLSAEARAALREAAGGTVSPGRPGRAARVPLDPLRAHARREAIERYRGLPENADAPAARALCGLIDQVATLPESAYAAVTPLIALSRQQTSRQVSEALLRDVAADPTIVRQALQAWRRVEGRAGANLDWRSVRDAVLRPDGQSRPAAVPGVEWLALQSVGWFRLTGSRGRPAACGWLPEGARPRTLVWPVWRARLDPAAVEVLLSHPEVRSAARGEGHGDRLRRLGVLAVLASERRREVNADGPLGPARVIWPSG